jgi:integrase
MARRIRGKNEGSLHQRPNGTWRAQLSVNGRRVSKGFKTRAECLAWLRQMQDQIDHGFNYLASKTSLGDYLLQWLEIVRPTLRLKTSHQYGQIIQKHILPNIARKSGALWIAYPESEPWRRPPPRDANRNERPG